MHSPIHPTTQLDLYRTDAAARMQRAATHRFVHDRRASGHGSRRPAAVSVATVLTFALLTGTAVATASEQPLPHGYEQGRPDGWYEPGSDQQPTTNLVPRNVR